MTEVLASHGYEVATAHDGLTGLEVALSTRPDLVILDVMMPRLDGFEVLRQLRRQLLAPIIMLTARTTPDDRVRGLRVGADDYVAKPFIVDELLARLEAVLRRSTPSIARTITVGPLRIDKRQRRVWADLDEIQLTESEFDILELLVDQPGIITSRSTIARTLNGRDITGYERTIDVHVSHLRKKLAAAGGIHIRAARGRGYLLEVEPE